MSAWITAVSLVEDQRKVLGTNALRFYGLPSAT